ncbi:MAG: DUF4364 family protein [Lachnospiraceae bacterium]|nr:DUF4364 family protein [Lachnospiraceae bacterium]
MLYKLIVLYMLDSVSSPMTKAAVSDFMLGKEYTHFLSLQQVLAQLEETGMMRSEPKGNRTLLSITEEGLSTLHFFENRISGEIKEDVQTYLKEKKWDIRKDVNITGEYYKTTGGDYMARLIAKEKGNVLMEVSLSVPSEETAASICANWQEKNEEIYQYLTRQLF